MLVAAILKNIQNHHILAAVQAIFVKFGPMTHYMYIIFTNHNSPISVFGVYFDGFLYTEGANNWGQILVCCLQLTQLIGYAARLLYYLITDEN